MIIPYQLLDPLPTRIEIPSERQWSRLAADRSQLKSALRASNERHRAARLATRRQRNHRYLGLLLRRSSTARP